MDCGNCGQSLAEGARFCPACGARVERPEGDERPTETGVSVDSTSDANAPEAATPVEGTQASPDDRVDSPESGSTGPPATAGVSEPSAPSSSAPPSPPGHPGDAVSNGTPAGKPTPEGATTGASSPSRRQPPAWAVDSSASVARARPRSGDAQRQEQILPAVHLVGETTLAQPGVEEPAPIFRPMEIPRTVGFFRTLIAFVYDVLFLVIGLTILISLGLDAPDPTPFFILAVGLMVLYFPVGYGNGRTVGNWATYTRVARVDSGEKPGVVRGIVRSITMIFSTMILFLGFLWALQDKQGQTWHDKVAGTILVDSRIVPEPEAPAAS